MAENIVYRKLLDTWKGREEDVMIWTEQDSCTFRQFLSRVCQIEDMLPPVPGRIGVVMEHGIDMIAAIFAVLKTGSCYVPAETFFPLKRIRFMFEDAGVSQVLVSPEWKDDLDLPLIRIADLDGQKALPQSAWQTCAKPEDPAYILYTSGTSGKPKGVEVTNRNICHYARAFDHEFQVRKEDIMLQYSVCSFDIFTEEVFASLLNGAALAIPSGADKTDIRFLMDFVERRQITLLSGFPYLLMGMNELEAIPESLRLLISGGDVLRDSYITHLKTQSPMIYNTYGPSETTVCASYYRCDNADPLEDGTYPVGKPVQDVQIRILDAQGQDVPAGTAGEICIAGNGVSNGYTGDMKQENEAFEKQPDGSVLYHSGDLGYFLPDGNIAFLHRKDAQVMILGRRVEPDEVENILIQIPGVETAVVVSHQDEGDLSYLTAYVVFETQRIPVSSLKAQMAAYLPDYMIPEFFVEMKEIPLTPNGKVDLAALPVVLKEGFRQ